MTASRNPVNATFIQWKRMEKHHSTPWMMHHDVSPATITHFTGCVFDFYSNQPPGGDQRASVFPIRNSNQRAKKWICVICISVALIVALLRKKNNNNKKNTSAVDLLLIIGDEQSAPSTTALQMPQNITERSGVWDSEGSLAFKEARLTAHSVSGTRFRIWRDKMAAKQHLLIREAFSG